jgi:hydrogenase-4 component D
VGAFTITGVPPFAGFWSKLFIITGALELGGLGTVLGILMLLESVVAFGWFLWIGQKVFFGAPSPAVARVQSRAPGMSIALVVLIILCLIIPVIALPIIGFIG